MKTLCIEAFLAVVREGSITAAATSLFISQSTLSNRITQLEQQAGKRLIDRSKGLRSLSLTESGQEFLALAKKWEEVMQEMKMIQSDSKNLKLSIGATETIHTYILPPVYKALNSHSENMNIRVKTVQSSELYTLLDRGEIDIAFTFLESPRPNIVIKKFYTEPMVIIRKETSPSSCIKVINHQDLDPSNELYIYYSDSPFQAWYDRWKGEREYPAIQLDTTLLLSTFMNRSGQWAIVPLSMARHFQSTGEFAIYQLEDPPPDRICYQIRPRYPRTNTSMAIEVLDSCLHSIFNQH